MKAELITIESNTGAQAAELVKGFVTDCNVRGLAATTRTLYAKTLTAFFEWIEGRNFAALSAETLIGYRDELRGRGLSDNSLCAYIGTLRHFFEWTERNLIWPNIAKGLKAAKRRNRYERQPLNVAQAAQLLDHSEESESLKNYAIINLMLHTGCRCVELARANFGDIVTRQGQRVLMIQGKGHTEKDTFVVLTDEAYRPLKKYLESRGRLNRRDPLFCSESNHNSGKRLTTHSISRIIKNGLRSIGIDDRTLTAHSLRHTAATICLREGGDIEQVQRMLRHASPLTTEIYTKTLTDERRLTNGGEFVIAAAYARQRSQFINI